MTKERIFLSVGHASGYEERYIQEALASHWITTGGAHVVAFESALANYLGNNVHVTALNTGTAGIHLGLILLGVQAGDVVLCQSMTFSASANPILYQRAIPVFIDSEKETWNLCPIALEQAIVSEIAKGKKPKAIIAVHLYGVPYQIDAVRAVADAYQIPILEDSAEALGSAYKGQKCGTFGDLAIVSFNGNKIITTSGGGAIVSHSKALKEKALFYATQSRDEAPHYQHSEIGYNYRMSNICAGIGRGQMEVLDDHVAMRRKMNDFYVDLFCDIAEVSVFTVPNNTYFANYWLSAILVEPNPVKRIDREALRLAFEAANIECRPLWKPMHLQPIFQDYAFYGSNIAETLFEKGLCLPSGSHLTDKERARISEVAQEFFKK
ncbi:pyridoxal phosphate-dependent aminotransferase [Flavobacterium sp. SOK18b]|uniref:DegT/DnrJ/EryC1/StrS family aminotransferase n=1 Tax=Flavobacterium sp. SOK18b TaxID=797900 RepID=UPI0015F91C3A|nr:DegT/DnrJ/EryC1/StrS family aminotransferase [Flavobacterium sp. SOK18b]MBB1194903.1 pyridoxal phosphate-dependent aminotransferase [Flavobacterium sp. SOK18b]